MNCAVSRVQEGAPFLLLLLKLMYCVLLPLDQSVRCCSVNAVNNKLRSAFVFLSLVRLDALGPSGKLLTSQL